MDSCYDNFFQILKYVLEVTSVKRKFAELTVGGKDKETWPDLRYSFDVSEIHIWLSRLEYQKNI